MSWLNDLQTACDQTSLGEVGRKIGYGKSTISLVLNGKYAGNLNKVRHAVETKLVAQNIDCPVLGTISAETCTDNHSKPLITASSASTRLWRACKNCPFNTRKKG